MTQLFKAYYVTPRIVILKKSNVLSVGVRKFPHVKC